MLIQTTPGCTLAFMFAGAAGPVIYRHGQHSRKPAQHSETSGQLPAGAAAPHSNATASCGLASTDLSTLLTVLMEPFWQHVLQEQLPVPRAQAATPGRPQLWLSALTQVQLTCILPAAGHHLHRHMHTCAHKATTSSRLNPPARRLSCKSAVCGPVTCAAVRSCQSMGLTYIYT
jgi:hypothetical protein